MAMNTLYSLLKSEQYSSDEYETVELGEDMFLLKQIIRGYWKPRYLIDERFQTAVEFMDSAEKLCTVTMDDICIDSLNLLDESCRNVAESLSLIYPSHIGKYKNDVSQVRWQLRPDGRYRMDEDGYGTTDETELDIYGFINRQGKVVKKFAYIQDNEEIILECMRMDAEIAVIEAMFK